MEVHPSLYALFRDDLAGRELLFSRPVDILTAYLPDDLPAVLETVERAHATGKWLAGYVSYEAGYLFEPRLRSRLPQGRRAPLASFGVFDEPLARATTANATARGELPVSASRPAWSFTEYKERFDRLYRHLSNGDCYQGNLTFPIHARWTGDPRAAFDRLTLHQPVRYGALVCLGDPIVLSRSPELFFEVDSEGNIQTLPMKGTAPRGGTQAEDRQLRDFLKTDPKNRAENLMIVDLLRNDISRISEVGTVRVPELFRVEAYATVHQMVSRVSAKLRPQLSIAEIFSALFPCGSVTGAPKLRVMEILRDLEIAPREVYCGAIGWIAPNGAMRFNVAIRTVLLYEGGEAVYNVGGGVVADSTAQEEYAECLLKARFVTGPEGLGAGSGADVLGAS